MSAEVTAGQIRAAARALGLSDRPLCVHSSLRSFGRVAGGAQTVIDGLLAEGCTVMVPTFSYDAFWIDPLPHQRRERNGTDYADPPPERPGDHRVYTPDSLELQPGTMGAIPAAVLTRPGRSRGDHPLCSFSAIGPLAHRLIAPQAPLRIWGPLEALAEADGAIVLMGVGLDRMTFLHLAEQRAGRTPFRSWANGPDGTPMEVEDGACSRGFPRLGPCLAALRRQTVVGQSVWHAYDAKGTLSAAAEAIRRHPFLTRCDRPICRECDDAILGGPILPGAAS
jgi:aminoglycoside N3'-acetyltransferase